MKKIIMLLTLLPVWLKAQNIGGEIQHANISVKEIEIELAKYPKNILQHYLENVTFVATGNFCGRAEAFSKRIILNAECSNSELKRAIHHEMSSVLLQQYDVYVERGAFDNLYRAFVNLNGDDFTYDNNIDMSKIPLNSKMSDYFYGIKYAKSGFENDFNIISQFLFSNGCDIINFMNSYPNKPVAKKIQLVLEFYQKIDKRFTISYFKNQRL